MKLEGIMYLHATDIIKSNMHILYANYSSSPPPPVELGVVDVERANYVAIEFQCRRTVDSHFRFE
jgi:hypothetical protein